MEYSDLIIFVMEIIGTVAFASSEPCWRFRRRWIFRVCVLGSYHLRGRRHDPGCAAGKASSRDFRPARLSA